MKALTAAALLALSGILAAGETIRIEDFEGFKTEEKDGVYTVKTGDSASFTLTSLRDIEVNPAMKYTISAEVKLDKGRPGSSMVLFGFIPYQGKGMVYPQFVQSAPGTNLGTLTAAAVKGAGSFTVSGANWMTMWKTPKYYNVFAAFNAKEDYSDLPNNDITGVKNIEEKDGNLLVTLSSPLKKAYAAGTRIRLTRNDGHIYCCRTRMMQTGAWVKMTASIQGYTEKGASSVNSWRPGTDNSKLVFIVLNAKDSEWSIRNVTVEVTDGKDSK